MSTDGSPLSLKKTTQGKLIQLKTKDEVHAAQTTVTVYILEAPEKSVKSLLDLVKSILPTNESPISAFQHLRRVCRPSFLPAHLKTTWDSDPEVRECAEKDSTALDDIPTLHLLLCTTSQINHSDLLAALSAVPESLFAPLKPHIRTIPVPEFAPTSQEQAQAWSARYWPTTFKNTNPHGPHPALVARAEAEILSGDGVAGYLQLASEVAKEGAEAGLGLRVGAVAVERTPELGARIVAVASDARWCGTLDGEKKGNGNPVGHVAMRLIGMVAKKRLHQSRAAASSSDELASAELYTIPSRAVYPGSPLDDPLIPLERFHLLSDTVLPNGYLCLNLELYLTHEPCVMCSMAIIHSRVGRVVFGRQMARTGALIARRKPNELEGNSSQSLQYGLFWRNELNWKFLCWVWEGDEDSDNGAKWTGNIQI